MTGGQQAAERAADDPFEVALPAAWAPFAAVSTATETRVSLRTSGATRRTSPLRPRNSWHVPQSLTPRQ
jgi:hypothetical protein